MADDFIGQGRRLANLREWTEKEGGRAVGAVALAGKLQSAKLNPTKEQLHALRQKNGASFKNWRKEIFGHAFDYPTQSEARHLARSPDVDAVRNRLAAAVRQGGSPSRRRSPREQKRRIRYLKEGLAERFPDSQPTPPRRPQFAHRSLDACRISRQPSKSVTGPSHMYWPFTCGTDRFWTTGNSEI